MREDNRPRRAVVETTLASLLLLLSSCVSGTQPGTGQNVTSVPQIGDPTPLATASGIPPTPTFLLESGKGAVVGTVDLQGASWEQVKVFLAPFYEVGDDGEGFYVLEPSVHPHALVHPPGGFRIVGLEPGDYVMLVGPDPMEALLVEADGQPRILRVLPGGVLNVGEIRYPLE